MSKSNTTENDVLKLMLQGTDPSWRSNATIYIALYNADPGEAGTAPTNETAYTNYIRTPFIKATCWTDEGSTFSNATLVQFPQCGATGDTITYVGIVNTNTGAGQLFISGQLNSSLAVANLIQPQFGVGALDLTED